MFNRKQGWTEADDAELRRLAAAKVSRLLIAAKMKRSLDAIKRRATALKIKVEKRPASYYPQTGETPPRLGGGV